MYKIMIVDDELSSQDMIQRYINSKLPNYEISNICSNGLEALSAFQQHPADIVLVDIRMPVMDGLTFLEHLGKITRDFVAIVISSFGEFEYAKTAMRLGVNNYLLKPLDFTELAQSLEAAAQALDYKRTTYTPPNLFLEDIRELYFQNILNGRFADSQAAFHDYTNAKLPVSYDSSKGLYIQTDFLETHNWTYGQDALVTATGNLISLLYQPLFLIPVMSEADSCHYVMFFDETPDDMDALCEQMESLLHIQISVKLLCSFDSIEHLRRIMLENPPAAATALSISDDMISEDDFIDLPEDILHQRIENAIVYMHRHYGTDLTRDTVAAAVYMSGAHFSRCFKTITGLSYKDYLTEIRMQKAIELLKTNMKISDISSRVGYPNPNRFNINFRHYTSYTPSEYRIHVLKML